MRRLAPPRRARRQREHGGDATTEGHAATGAHCERRPGAHGECRQAAGVSAPGGVGPLARPGHLTQQDVGAR